MSRNRLSYLGLTATLVLITIIAGGGQAWATDSGTNGLGASLVDLAPDAALARLQENANAAGALGIYLEESTQQYVVVGPPGSTSTLRRAGLDGDGVNVRIEEGIITDAEITSVSRALENYVRDPRLAGHTYSFGFDPEAGRVVLSSAAPETAFIDVMTAFPNLIDFRHTDSEAVLLSRTNDSEPYWGGVRIAATQGNCSAGFTIRKTANGLGQVPARGVTADPRDPHDDT